jgi:transposase
LAIETRKEATSMAMGRKKRRQDALFIMAAELPKPAGHPFYKQLNQLLAEAQFDQWIEGRCQAYYSQEEKRGQPSIPPGVYFRMLLVGYFENLDSQRGIAWRCSDSLSLREFLGVGLEENTPDHSTLTNTRKRLPPEVFEEVFQFVLGIAEAKKLLSGQTVGVDSTMLEANAAMKSIVRRDTGEDWKAYVTRLMKEDGLVEKDQEPTDEEIRRYDKRRKHKKVSNQEWVSKSDPESEITQMKDGRTHLAYKAEHVVDLKSDLVLAAEIRPATAADTQTMVDSVIQADVNLKAAGSKAQIAEVAADKGYHAADTLELAEALNMRTYIPEPKHKYDRRWTDKPAEFQQAVYNNRRRVQRQKGKQLQRLRSELCERSFAHICDTGGSRRSWLRSLVNVTKRYLIAAAAHNLGRILRALFGIGKPKSLQDGSGLAALLQFALCLRQLIQIMALDAQRRYWPPTYVTSAARNFATVRTVTSTVC